MPFSISVPVATAANATAAQSAATTPAGSNAVVPIAATSKVPKGGSIIATANETIAGGAPPAA